MTDLDTLDWTADGHRIEKRRENQWRSYLYGTLYTAEQPESTLDTMIATRTATTREGIALGEHPELGTVRYASGELPQTTMSATTYSDWTRIDTPNL